MAKSAKTELVIQPEIVDISVNLDKGDVASILMARAEDQLKQDINTCQRIEKKLEKECKALAKQRDEKIQEAVDMHFEATIETLAEAAATLKAKNFKATAHHHGHIDACVAGGKPLIECSLSVTGTKPNISWAVNQSIRMPAAIKSLITANQAKHEDIAANTANWMDLRRKLADLPSLERRAKAAVAEQRLTSTAEGRDLLNMLDGKLADSIKQLGIH